MPEFIVGPIDEDYGVWKYSRRSWYKAGLDNYTAPPGQNPDRFLQLLNIQSPMTNNLLRRWGYRSFKPKWDTGATASSDEAASSVNAAAVIKARRLYDYENQSIERRTLIATVADGSGSSSLTNNVIYWDKNAAAQVIFNPSTGAYSPRAVNSRDYEYFVDGVAADLKKVFITDDGLFYHFDLSAAGNTDGTNTVYTGTNLSAFVAGMSITISGFVTHAAQNNGTFTVVSSTDTTITVNNPSGIAETIPAVINFSSLTNWGIVAPDTAPTVGLAGGGGSLSFALSAAANHVGGDTTYTGVGLTSIIDNTVVSIAGFTDSHNNGDFTVVSHTPTTVTVDNPSGVAETTAAILSTANRIFPTVTTNGWAANAHVELAPSGTVGQDYFGLWNHTTQPFNSPGNAIDGDETTYTDASASAKQVNACIYTFATLATSVTNLTLSVLTEVPTGGINVGEDAGAVFYSLDGGTTWSNLVQSANYPKQWATVALSDSQDLSQVQVMIENVSHGGMATRVYEIKIEGVTVGSQPTTLTQGRVYYVVYGNSITGNWSDLSPASISSGPVEGGSIPLTNIPVSSDPQVNEKAILATADGGDPSILYLVAIIPNSQTSYTDTMSELVLLTQIVFLFTDSSGNEYGVVGNDPPPVNGKFPTKHAGRIWLLDGPFLQYSKTVGELTTSTGFIAGRYEEDWPPEFQIDISEVSEIGKGLLSDGQTLYVGTSRHIRRVTGDDPSNFSPAQVVFRDVGLLNQDVWSVVYIESTPIGAMWMTPDYRVILSDFNSYSDVGVTIQTTLNTINRDADTNSWACFLNDGPYNYYMLAIPTGSNTDPDTLCVFDTRIKEWYIWKLADKVDSGIFYFNLFGVPRWFFIDSNGKPRLFDKTTFLDRSNDNDGGQPPVSTAVPISHIIQTTWLDIADGNLRKAINEMELITTVTDSLVSLDGASTSAEFASPLSVLSNNSLIQDVFGVWKVFVVGDTAKSRFYRITITGASTSASSPTDELLGGLILEILPIHKY